ncbi:uncharacterized protein LAESUDRAFT_811762 [Laetiporus sulphureus 93-53]|uniref:F-box domain-containing protein n=1 Tax=Laetiporus sulphureus 93-53 TaxID=1314785 RepID=A0A165EX40_9APHY|nr:uncharacterized protein LAESUDRAFT_811762 [Laetiporus sulphureus 93-53]KZT07912.1 hypothetical protein LAESUDRAFT_811762 [Laetiporus sulphureus 93-53]
MSTRTMSSKAKGHPPTAKARTRKVLRAVNTNVLSYDRTDPFTALSSLRMLLASLPSRIGGCQFKLSPDEHKLSLHLLTIVEPFVGLAPSRRTLTRQPTEILDAIIAHVDEKRDLLACALSCRRLYNIIFPRHYDYRVVRCKVSSLRVWNHLIVHRALARNIRRLEVLDERSTEPESVPSDILASDTDIESTDDELGMHDKQGRLLASAMARMSSLQTFVWSCNHSPISIGDVWPTLMKCQTLRQVEISDNLIFTPTAAGEVEVEHSGGSSRRNRQPVLPSLKIVNLQSTKYTYGATKNPNMSRISGMLANCAAIESLNVTYTTRRAPGFSNPVTDDFLLCGRWPRLKSLVLTNLRCSSQAALDTMSTFLFAHLDLEVLHLDVALGSGQAGGTAGNRQSLSLLPNCLPRLRELKASKEVMSAVLKCPCAVSEGGRPLETIKGVSLSGSKWDGVFLSSLKQHGTTVKRLELASWNDMDDVRKVAECAPQLIWLDIGKRIGNGAANSHASTSSHTGRAAPAISTQFAEWANILSQMSNLTTFHGVRFFYEIAPTALAPGTAMTLSDRSRVRKNDEVASLLARKCGKLRRLDHWEEGSGKVIVLLRDEDKVRYEVRRLGARA